MDTYKELYESLAKTVVILEDENKKMLAALSMYVAKDKQWELERVNQVNIIQTMLTQKNKEHNDILEENQKLREQLRQARSM